MKKGKVNIQFSWRMDTVWSIQNGRNLRVLPYTIIRLGAQWLSGRVLDSRPRGRGFEPHRRHCVVVLEQDTSILA